jgi:uncharacterized RDD family membrane protein YckC
VILMRYFPIWVVSLIPFVGAFLILIDLLSIFRSDQRCIHDWLAGTRVVAVSWSGDSTTHHGSRQAP